MTWYIFSTTEQHQENTLEKADSYSAAVLKAQEDIGTTCRPKRVFDGMYKVRNASLDNYRARYIVRADSMTRYGFGHLAL